MSTEDTPEITKRRVTMLNSVAVGVDAEGKTLYQDHVAIDYVRPDFLDAYVEDARTRWAVVTVSDEVDAGPGGYEGDTVIPETLNIEGA